MPCAVCADRAAADEEPQAALHHPQGRQRGHQAGETLATLGLALSADVAAEHLYKLSHSTVLEVLGPQLTSYMGIMSVTRAC